MTQSGNQQRGDKRLWLPANLQGQLPVLVALMRERQQQSLMKW
jgi:hypothetical protein